MTDNQERKKNYHNSYVHEGFISSVSLSYLPTPPLGQDMTQGQFLSRV